MGAVCAAMFLALLGVRNFDAENAPRDEILAYEVSADSGVEVTLQGGVGQISLTSWLIVPLGTPVDEPLPYGLSLRLTDSDGNVRMTRRFDNQSRVAPIGPDGESYQARVADAVGLVTEPRTIDADVSALAGKAGRLRVQAVPGRYSQVLLRLAHRVERGAFSKALLARTMSSSERSALTRERSSLGFFDMPDEVRADALSYWHQRLTAAGREGRDYRVRRLLIGQQAQTPNEELPLSAGIESSPAQRFAINVDGPVTLRLRASEATQVVADPAGPQAPSRHTAPAGRWIELSLGEPLLPGVQSWILYSESPSRLALTAPLEDIDHFVTPEPPQQSAGRLELRPSTSYQPAYALHPTEPVVFGVAPAQPRMGLSVRSTAATDTSACATDAARETTPRALERAVEARWRAPDGSELRRIDLALGLRLSCFERIAGAPVSERQLAYLHVPAGATELWLHGPDDLVITPFVPEPGVEEVVFSPPYDQPVPEGLAWRHAPMELKDWALIRPDNEQSLARAGRRLTLEAQIRLEPVGRDELEIAPRTLEPVAEALSRPVFTPATHSPRSVFPEYGWILMSSAQPTRQVVVPPSGDLQLLYLADPNRLGQAWSVWAAGASSYTGTLSFRSGARHLILPPGSTSLEASGLGERGLLLAQAAPAEGGSMVRRQTFHALEPGASIEFDFQRRTEELLALSVTVATAGGSERVTLEHSVDRGRDRARADHFYRRTSQYEGRHQLRTGELGPALIWSEPFGEQASSLPDRLGRLVIPLGDDLGLGRHRLRVSRPAQPGGKRVWIRAVLVGRVLGHP